METDVLTPTLDPRSIREIIFSYDNEYDLAWFHINERRAAFTLEVDGGIYLRQDEGDVVGMEVHDFSRAFADNIPLARATVPAIAEIEAFAGRKLDESFEMRATADQLPTTTQMLVFVIAHALATHEAELRANPAR